MASVTLADVNVLVAAFREGHPHHLASAAWLQTRLGSDAPFGLCERVLEGFLRVVTHPQIFDAPDSIESAIEYVEDLTDRENCVIITPGARQWSIFLRLAADAGATGNAVSDSWLAALAIESGSEWITWDKGFARYPGLRWSTPATFS
jgi:toxin-antitoxin system PIN domain toxin